ncbi:hypothetical protein BSKO_05834 [Bryopsis sp. KO-2023]|nr:hypothetical protein BSKO_05834 [Bryopsis sp. KO-2023]
MHCVGTFLGKMGCGMSSSRNISFNSQPQNTPSTPKPQQSYNKSAGPEESADSYPGLVAQKLSPCGGVEKVGEWLSDAKTQHHDSNHTVAAANPTLSSISSQMIGVLPAAPSCDVDHDSDSDVPVVAKSEPRGLNPQDSAFEVRKLSSKGWRMIAQEVMREVEEHGTITTQEEEHFPRNDPPPQNKLMSESSLQRARVKSIIAKAGENFYTDYQLLEHIGSGAFGRAMKAKRRTDQETVVVKEVLIGRMSEKERYETKNEVKVLAHLSHPNVVKYYDFYADGGKMHIVMEYCEEGDLAGYLKDQNGEYLEENEIMLKFVQICLALQNIHNKGILHRDLKTQNIFLSSKGIVKLGDFGISKVLGADQAMARSMVGTPYYLSPEMCEDKPYGPKSDVWSLGCVLYELCTLKHAFDGGSLPALVIKILSGKFPPIPPKYSEQLKNVVNKVLSKDPDARPTLDEILNYDYVRTHMQRYAAHIHFCVERRRESFKRSLQAFDITDEELADPSEEHPRRVSFERGAEQRRRSRTSSSSEARARASTMFDLAPILEEESNLSDTLNTGTPWLDVDEDDDEEAEGLGLHVSPYKNYSQDVEVRINRGRTTEAPSLPITPLFREHSEAKEKLRFFKYRLTGQPPDSPSVGNEQAMSRRSASDSNLWRGDVFSNPIAEVPQDKGDMDDAMEEGYATDKEEEAELCEDDDSSDDCTDFHPLELSNSSPSMQEFRADAPNVIAQMHEILNQPASVTLSIGRITTSSESEDLLRSSSKEAGGATIFKQRATVLREKAEAALGKHILEDAISYIRGVKDCDGEEVQKRLSVIMGPEKVEHAKLIYKMLQAEDIAAHLKSETMESVE